MENVVVRPVLNVRWLAPALVVVPLAMLNIALAVSEVIAIAKGGDAIDWWAFASSAERFWSGGLYASDDPLYLYRYSPVLAPFLAPLLWIGQEAWRLLHFPVVFALPDWRLRLVILTSFPFWFDVHAGGIGIFALVLAWHALEGRRWAVAGYVALCLVAPKPLFLPVLAWLLWQRPGLRWPFIAAAVGHGVLVMASGWGDEWIDRLLSTTSELASEVNYGPSALVGPWWVPVGATLAAWWTWKGRLGLASLAASPYWLPYYFLPLALELLQNLDRRDAAQPLVAAPRPIRATARRVHGEPE